MVWDFQTLRGNGLRQQTVSAAKCAGIAAMAAQGRHSLVRNEVTQNSPDFNRPGCKLRRTHILPSGEYKSAPFVPKGLFVWYNLCNSSTFVVINIEADMVFRIICINIYFNIITMIFRHIIITDINATVVSYSLFNSIFD